MVSPIAILSKNKHKENIKKGRTEKGHNNHSNLLSTCSAGITMAMRCTASCCHG